VEIHETVAKTVPKEKAGAFVPGASPGRIRRGIECSGHLRDR